MITLNLISSGQKKEIKLRHLYGFIKTFNLVLIIIIIVIAIILLIAKTILQAKFTEVVNQTTLVTKTNQSYNNKVRAINNKLNFIEKIQAEFIPWSDLLIKLANITPADINLNYVRVESLAQTIKIRGRAKLRSSLLNFKDEMEATGNFEKIDFPIKNILEKEDIDFEITAKLNFSNL